MKKKSKADSVHELVAEAVAEAAEEKSSHKKVGKKQAPKKQQQTFAPDKLMVMVSVVNRNKAEYFLDLIQSFQCNFQFSCSAQGTAQRALGLLTPDTEKTVIFSVITKENSKLALYTLQKKFSTIRGAKGIAFTVPMTSTIGVLLYRFLSNKE